jgi:hypothetical protein
MQKNKGIEFDEVDAVKEVCFIHPRNEQHTQ